MTRKSGLKILLGAVFITFPSYCMAGFTFVPIIIEHREIWNVERDTPFAVWEAASSVRLGSEVAIDRNSDIVDHATLLPHSVYAVDQDFSGNNSLLLPKGGLLIKMEGGDGNWFCTWRYGDHSNVATADVWEKRELCLQAELDKPISDATLELSLYPEMLTILPSVITKRIKGYNPVNLIPVENSQLPSRTDLEVHARWKEVNGGSICLNYTMKPLFGPDSCFGAVGQSIDIMGGSYTLLSVGPDRSARIRIDRAINVSGIRPRIRSH